MNYTETGNTIPLFEKEIKSKSLMEANAIKCGQCSFVFIRLGNKSLINCPVCGNPLPVSSVPSKAMIFSDAKILPFKTEQAGLKEAVGKWIKNKPFSKSGFRKLALATFKELQGVYLPYWRITGQTNLVYDGSKGVVVREYGSGIKGSTSDSTSTYWKKMNGTVINKKEWIFPATRSFDTEHLDYLEPWDLENLTMFSLTDQQQGIAELPDKDIWVCWESILSKRKSHAKDIIEKEIGGDYQKIFNLNSELSNVIIELVMLPVYVSSVRFKDKTYTIFINSRTAEVQGEWPKSYFKLGLFFGVLLLVIIKIIHMIATAHF